MNFETRLTARLAKIVEDADIDHDEAVSMFTAAKARLAKSGINISPAQLGEFLDDNNIGEGNSAIAYSFGDKVVKLTADKTDAQTHLRLIGKQHPNLPVVYDVFSSGKKDLAGSPLWFIVSERIAHYPDMAYGDAMNLLSWILQEETFAKSFYSGTPIKTILKAWASRNPEESRAATVTAKSPAFNHLVKVLLNLSQIGIRPTDVQDQNWGMRGSEPVLYDLGFTES